MTDFRHTPIMVEQVLSLLAPKRGGVFVDGTLGGGGHAEAVLSLLPKGSKLYGIDRDGAAIAAASTRLSSFGDRFKALRGNFFELEGLLRDQGEGGADGILLDLGVSSHQLDTPQRGFSYHEDAPLDMRMDASASFSAYEVVNGYRAEELCRVIREYGEERFAGRVANAIVRAREAEGPIQGTLRLAEIIKNAIPAANRREGPHPARRTFQALRIEVNGELEGLDKAVGAAHGFLRPGGRMAVITFHSLEDRIVKQAFKRFENPCTCDPRAPMCTCGKKPTVHILTKKPYTADEKELSENSRARSAKLRGIEKL